MSKKQLIIVICLITSLALIFVIFAVVKKVGQQENAATPERSQLNGVTTKIEKGTLFINYSSEGVSIAIPEHWTSYYYPQLREGVYASYNYNIDTFAYAKLYFKTNESKISMGVLKQENPGYNINFVEEGEGQTKYYGSLNDNEYYDGAGPVTGTKYDSDTSKDNYVIGRMIEHANGIVYSECLTRGSEYAELISVCDSIIESLSIE
jgi:hypothetical protein